MLEQKKEKKKDRAAAAPLCCPSADQLVILFTIGRVLGSSLNLEVD